MLARAYALATGVAAEPGDVPCLAALMGKALVFPSAKRDTPLSDMALSAVMRRMNECRPEGAPAPWRDADGRAAVPHRFRATFRTWVDDERPGDAVAAEKALAHEDANKVRAAYARSSRSTSASRSWMHGPSGAVAGGDAAALPTGPGQGRKASA